jgi:hypothetical protein
MSDFAIRAGSPDEEALVYSSWLKSYRGNNYVSSTPNRLYFKYQHDLIGKLLGDSRTEVFVAASNEDLSYIYGWVAGARAPATIHFLYVKHLFRGWGIAWGLAEKLGVTKDSAVLYTTRADAGPFLGKKVKEAELVEADEWLP